MKSLAITGLTKKMVLSIFALVMILSFIAPDIKTNFAVSSVVPAARGFVKIKKDGKNNFKISISVSDLLLVTALTPPKQMYVVWMVTDQYITKNIGQLSNVSNTNKKAGKATLEVISALKPSKIYITAEDDALIQHPGIQVILATNRF